MGSLRRNGGVKPLQLDSLKYSTEINIFTISS